MSFWLTLQKNPYRLFFTLGAVLAFIGITPWALVLINESSYPRDLHRQIMINGFLLSFVCGFLMTAVPKFTGSFAASKIELSVIFSTLVLAAVAIFFLPSFFSYGFAAVAIAALIVFAGKRFARRSSNPPFTFVFIGVGLLLWFLSNVVQSLIAGGVELSPGAQEFANGLFTNGALMCLILGVGGRLIPAILGWQDVISHQRERYEKDEPFLAVVPLDVWLAVAVFFLSFVLQPWFSATACLLARAVVVLYFGVKYWRVHRPPKARSYLTWSLWLSCWCLIGGYFLSAFWPEGGVHAMHVLFIGGFSLLTLLISTRVSLAHGGAGPAVEKTSPGILIFTSILLLAALTRVTAIVWPRIYRDHLGYAAILWIAGLALWAWTIYSKLRSSEEG